MEGVDEVRTAELMDIYENVGAVETDMIGLTAKEIMIDTIARRGFVRPSTK